MDNEQWQESAKRLFQSERIGELGTELTGRSSRQKAGSKRQEALGSTQEPELGDGRQETPSWLDYWLLPVTYPVVEQLYQNYARHLFPTYATIPREFQLL